MDSLRPGDPATIGPFRLKARLGQGGMGEVFLGESPGGREVAVKLIRAEHAADPDFRERFVREVDAASRVGGFHTAQVVAADPTAAMPWMATAFVPGLSLRDEVIRGGPLAPSPVRSLGAALAEGLAAIHACGLVHRDLKPGNVIMSPDGPRIIDFGIARVADVRSLTSDGAVFGTYAYMAPEQVRGGRVGPAADVFALGCVLAFAATGRGPFDAAAIPAIVHRILNGRPHLDGITGDLRGLIEACLFQDPVTRPSTLAILDYLADPGGRPLPLTVPTSPYRPAQPLGAKVATSELPATGSIPTPTGTRRMPRRAMIFGALGAVAAAGTPAVLLLRRRGEAPPPTPTPTPS
ncbi:serine/threonine-protein kinase, partial [Nonomuraea sp. NPDC005983]|uniref:serine/threonine-protein kinase n=1 Tax=Nonomuraea sp. NPDC005983 TaxID=3155595 RepID=UPI0033A8AC67